MGKRFGGFGAKGYGMAEYYRYLWLTTWPVLVSFVSLWLFVLVRFAWKARNTWGQERDVWGLFVLFGKGILWVGVLAVYTVMFTHAEGDWFSKPAMIQGVIQGKAFEEGRYIIRVETRGNLVEASRNWVVSRAVGSLFKSYFLMQDRWVYVDFQAYKALSLGDAVKVTCLPIRREALSCQVLNQ
ncbi:MAG: hypothetical protein ACYCVD_06335 [Desulfitobacteriaceae bacterium]